MQKDCVMDNLHIWLVEIAAFNKKNSGQLYKEASIRRLLRLAMKQQFKVKDDQTILMAPCCSLARALSIPEKAALYWF